MASNTSLEIAPIHAAKAGKAYRVATVVRTLSLVGTTALAGWIFYAVAKLKSLDGAARMAEYAAIKPYIMSVPVIMIVSMWALLLPTAIKYGKPLWAFRPFRLREAVAGPRVTNLRLALLTGLAAYPLAFMIPWVGTLLIKAELAVFAIGIMHVHAQEGGLGQRDRFAAELRINQSQSAAIGPMV